MTKKLENIFDECLDRIFRGESIESCLASYPEEATELEPLLRTALGFSWRASSIQPRPEFKAQARLRIQEAQFYTSQQKQPEKAGVFIWQRSWAFALTAVLIVILLAGTGTVAAAADAMPDKPLYPVKLATEQARLALTFSNENKVKLHTQLAENRAQEIAVMANQGKTEYIEIATEKLVVQLNRANYTINRVEQTEVKAVRSPALTEEAAAPYAPDAAPYAGKVEISKIERLKRLKGESTTRNLTLLEDALKQAPDEVKPALRQAIRAISEQSIEEIPQRPVIEDEDNTNDNKTERPPLEPKQIPTETEPVPFKPRPVYIEPDPTTTRPEQNQTSTRETDNNTGKTDQTLDTR